MKTPTADELRFTLREEFGDEVSTKQLKLWAMANDVSPSGVLNRMAVYKSGHGKFNLAVAERVDQLEHTYQSPAVPEPVIPSKVAVLSHQKESLIPRKDDLYVPFGNFKDLSAIIKSKIFYTVFITGLSGNGKTMSVEQGCARNSRELIVVPITIETDEDDLLGGFRLVDGNTVWHNGPAIEAMEKGAILLLDEIDLASNKIMCLQSIVDGKPVFLKKINKWVYPAKGFNVIATANTKGRGSDNGKFIGTNVLNEAFLERFAVTMEQEYPSIAIEKKILLSNFGALGIHERADKITNDLVTWADLIRKTYEDGGIEDIITTRRLVNVVKAYGIWNDILKAITFCTNRFDEDTKKVFVDLYKKVSAEVEKEEEKDPYEGKTNEDLVKEITENAFKQALNNKPDPFGNKVILTSTPSGTGYSAINLDNPPF
jgi:MoxR-like ATPase